MWVVSLFLLALIGCSKSTDAEQAPTEPIDNRTPILLATNKIVAADVLSRGIGGVGGTEGEGNNWNGETLYIYGVTPESVPIANQQATAPSGAARGGISWASGPFYYGSNDTYNFYGYHVDDATITAPTPTGSGAYTLDFTINGTQDVMVASTNKTQDIADSGDAEAIGKEANLYSAWSARRNVIPNLVFKHLLSRLNFRVVAGSNDTGSLTNMVHISKIEVFSKSKGTLIVVPKGEGEDKEQGIKNMQDIPADAPTPFLVMKAASTPAKSKQLETLTPVPAANAAANVGVGILVYPAESYRVVIHTSQVTSGTPKEGKIAWTITPPSPKTSFEAGSAYKVTIKVYKLEDIRIDATLTPWIDGGEVSVDPDDGITF